MRNGILFEPKKKPGRPRSKNPRNKRLHFRVTDKDYQDFEYIAKKLKLSKSDLFAIMFNDKRNDMINIGFDLKR